MNQKITIQRFAAAIAEKADVAPELALEYTRELFGIITRELHKGEPVSIKEIGTFELSHIPGKPIVYTPAQKVADEVNAPFVMFESEDLADEVTDEMLNEIVVPSSEAIDDEAVIVVTTEIEVSEEKSEVSPIEIQEESNEEAQLTYDIIENQSTSNVEDVASVEPIKSEIIVTNEVEIIEAEPSDNSDMQQEEQEVPPTYIPPIPTTDYLPEDEEEFVVVAPESKSSKLLFGITVGLVIGLAVAALALVAYTAFVD